MSRAKFDRDEVIASSVDLFWRHGFDGSSMQQVADVTGLKPGSIYLAFGNKQGLYWAALEQYTETRLTEIQRCVDQAPTTGEAICQTLRAKVAEVSHEEYNSCFLVKSQLELASKRADLHHFASQKLQEIEALYARCLTPEHGQELAATRATNIMVHIFGLRVYGYHKRPHETMLRVLYDGLPWLPWHV